MKILKNIFWLLSEKGSQILIGIIISGLLARNLGIVNFGYFQYTLSIILLFSSITYICGSEVIIPRLINASTQERNSVITNGFLLRLFASLFGSIFFFLYIINTDIGKEFPFSVLLLSIIVLIREPFNIIVSILQAECNEKIAVWIRILALFLKLLLLFVAVYFNNLNFNIVSVAWLFESVLIATTLTVLIKHIEKKYIFSFDRKKIIYLLGVGIKFWVGLIFMYLFLRLDRIFIMYKLDPVTLGIYSAATQITDNIVTLAPIIAISCAPILIYNKDHHSDIIKNVFLLTFIMALIGFIVAITGYFLSPLIIKSIFSEKYYQSIDILKYLFLLCIPIFIDAGLNTLIIKNGNGYLIIAKWFIALAISFIINLLNIEKLGVSSIILSNLFGYISAVIFGFIYIFMNRNKT
ncbi:oligosaccharide flippase family protein [Xenorhabdus bovienii]|uniref:Oligosaccharide flippase family protein n=1 Tax=Xenorhabdus bovienii TaxID=40576 RepID=A0AAJ1JAD2_XENBV|nr:oligosaccharide flippase family protein [Xenorhabdus bovienii]MDE1474604.1 oligosaccharide flippase family protein [Xenorhabdus bovienii]MDE1478363.1 oligosaccharide flippase family protein [Xenorhabdus bovienii]MDE9509989.1 oligosaccharide flippase family protein [Xenorhabdus bovienii]MDE9521631.1 oligosaccharide flippase family protein [Xenorhabdus bovienii]